jgi:addiction module RelE/StbE family toxin
MGYDIRYLPLAVEDLKELTGYLLCFYPATASSLLGELEQRIARLRDHPRMCEEYTGDRFYRRMVVEDYLVFYHIGERERVVDIHRVLRGSWDINTYLRHCGR